MPCPTLTSYSVRYTGFITYQRDSFQKQGYYLSTGQQWHPTAHQSTRSALTTYHISPPMSLLTHNTHHISLTSAPSSPRPIPGPGPDVAPVLGAVLYPPSTSSSNITQTRRVSMRGAGGSINGRGSVNGGDSGGVIGGTGEEEDTIGAIDGGGTSDSGGGISDSGGVTTRVSMRGALPLSLSPLDLTPLVSVHRNNPPSQPKSNNMKLRSRTINQDSSSLYGSPISIRSILAFFTITTVLVLLYRWLTKTKSYRKPATSPPPPSLRSSPPPPTLRVAVPRSNGTTISSVGTGGTAMGHHEGLKSPISSGLRCRTPIHTPLSPPPSTTTSSSTIGKTTKW